MVIHITVIHIRITYSLIGVEMTDHLSPRLGKEKKNNDNIC
jgi:hypothetical protein